MKAKSITFILICLICSCKNSTNQEIPNVDVKTIGTNFMDWWTYHNENIVLSSEFIAVDEDSKVIDKAAFFKALTTGNYVPLKLESAEEKYKLFRLGASVDNDIKSTIKNISVIAYNRFRVEGTKFPEFNFTDLNGNKYTNSNTKGKQVFVKCWFINCKPCVAEFPRLNAFVEANKNREDLVFISLALDGAEDLKVFLKSKAFNYATVPNQEEFIKNKLHVSAYPTHFLVDEEGIIKKMVPSIDELFMAIDSTKIIIAKNVATENTPPPPPSVNY